MALPVAKTINSRERMKMDNGENQKTESEINNENENFGNKLPVKSKGNNSLPNVRLGFLLEPFNRIFIYFNDLIQKIVPEELNPLANSGAIANFSFIIAIISGILLLFWYVPSLRQAYSSLDEMSSQIFSSQLLRSLHRYSSDACILFATIHGAQLFFARRFTGPRWLAWVTGIFSIGLLWFIGWIGYWLVWDSRAKAIAIESSEQLDILPIFADPLSRSFLTDATINTLLFFVIFFFHMVLPMGMAVALWLHITRLNRSKFLPKIGLSALLCISFISISFIKPALNSDPALMSKIQTSYTMDYFYLAPIYLLERLSSGSIWMFVFFGAIALYSIPWAMGKKTPIVSEVDISKCNACRKCFEDCPYNAITMVPRTDGKKWDAQASVNSSLCVGCGICTASCSTSGISIPWLTTKDIRNKIDDWITELLNASKLENTLIAFLCSESAGSNFNIDPETGVCKQLPGYKVFEVPCAGWVHMNVVSYALQKGIKGILITGCKDGACSYREGANLAERRLIGQRAPLLKEEFANQNKVYYLRISKNDNKDLIQKANEFYKTKIGSIELSKNKINIPSMIGSFFILSLSMLIIYFLSDSRYYSFSQPESEFVVSFKHPGNESVNCLELSKEELEKLPIHMRKITNCERKRSPVRMKIILDGKEFLNKSYKPKGVWEDGNSIAIETIPLKSGLHDLSVEISGSPDGGWEFKESKKIEFVAGEKKVLLFNKLNGFTWY